MSPEDRTRFWSRVQITEGCWLWLAGVNGNGYGAFYIAGRQHLAHRVAWEDENGAIPAGLHACHSCDTPRCVRPGHIWVGTNADNIRDCVAKGRRVYHGQQSGERNGRAILTEAQVRSIRQLYATGIHSQHKLATTFGVSRSTIKFVVQNMLWAHVAQEV